MINLRIVVLLILLPTAGLAQRIVVDPMHLATVIENAAVRSSAESTHNNYLGKINNDLQTINTNVGSVVMAQKMIYQSLCNVNSALKNGLAVRDMANLATDIANYSRMTIEMARSEPYLLLFAEQHAAVIRTRATQLVADISAFILKEGDNVLADYNSRDQLLMHVRYELQLISALAYGAWKVMFWAKERGIIASLNPFATYLNQDKRFVEEIIRNAKFLKQ